MGSSRDTSMRVLFRSAAAVFCAALPMTVHAGVIYQGQTRQTMYEIECGDAFGGDSYDDAIAAPDMAPIGRDELAKILAVAPTKWKAGILLALNLALYPSELAAIRKDELDLDAGTFASRCRKTGIVRVGVLWQRTIDAVRAHLAAEPHPHAETLFVNKLGLPYNGQHVSRNWRKIVERAGLTGVEFAQLRDGAYTAAVEAGVSFDACKLLAGHATGIADAYASRRPGMVGDACRAIERAYFG